VPALCPPQGTQITMYCRWLEDFLEAGEQRLLTDNSSGYASGGMADYLRVHGLWASARCGPPSADHRRNRAPASGIQGRGQVGGESRSADGGHRPLRGLLGLGRFAARTAAPGA
jgi:hypothetical protein